MKECTCEICGATVSKRQSVAYKTGRICRSHSEANEELQKKHAQMLDKLAKQKQEMLDAQKKREASLYGSSMLSADIQEKSEYDRSHCWVCGRAGVQLHHLPLVMLLAVEKMKQTGVVIDILHFQTQALNVLGLSMDSLLSYIRLMPDSRLWFKELYYAQASEILGEGVLCRACCIKHKLQKAWDERINAMLAAMPVIQNPEVVAAMGAIYETSELHAQIEKLTAEDVLTEEAAAQNLKIVTGL